MSEAATFDNLRDLYQRTLVERARAPRHASRLAAFDATARGDNPRCGDRCTVFVRRDGDSVAEVGYEARGCAISIASADLMAEAIEGRSAGDIRAMVDGVRGGYGSGAWPSPLRALSGVAEYPSRVACATLPWDALLAALEGTR